MRVLRNRTRTGHGDKEVLPSVRWNFGLLGHHGHHMCGPAPLSKCFSRARQTLRAYETAETSSRWLVLTVVVVSAVLALFSVAVGVWDLWRKNSLFEFDIDNESLKWLAIVWALHEAMPGMVFAGCGLVHL